jgi:hypothetical protein
LLISAELVDVERHRAVGGVKQISEHLAIPFGVGTFIGDVLLFFSAVPNFVF